VKLDGYLGADLSAVPDRARRLESLGYDGAFSAEGPHEPFLALALAGQHSERLQLMTNVAIAFARSPLDVAQLADDLQRSTGGRFLLGLGSQIRPHIENRFSMPWGSPAARIREFVLAVKAIQSSWQNGERLEFRGRFYHHTLMTPFFSPGPNPHGSPPVIVAALGPKMTAAAAEVADGLVIHPFHSGSFVLEQSMPAVDRGLEARRRPRNQFTLAATVMVAAGLSDQERDVAAGGVRSLIAFYGSTPAYRVVLEHHGWGPLQSELNLLSKQQRWNEMASIVPDEVIDALVVSGAPADIASAIDRRYGGILDRVSLSMPYAVSDETLAEIVAGFRSPQTTA
jgi:probable F420-dependent oxidoreductase